MSASPRLDGPGALAILLATLVVVAYVVRAAVLVLYPWEWSPDEGLSVEYARRAHVSFEALYPRSAVPFPGAYTPLLPLLLAPFVEDPGRALLPARLIALGWTLAGAGAVFVLACKRGGLALGAAGAALALAPFDMTFFHTLARVDGLMCSLWLAAAAVLMPGRIGAHGETLSGGRLWVGALLLLSAVLAKPTAVLHGAPLVLGWLVTDRRSGARLIGVMAIGGGLLLIALQLASDGGFLFAMRLWALHDRVPGQVVRILTDFFGRAAPVLALAAAGFVLAWRAGARPWLDGVVLLLAGGLVVVPTLAKGGAMWNYLLPLLAATAVAAARWWAQARLRPGLGALLLSTVALAVAAARPFPLPVAADFATSQTFFGYIRQVVDARGGPILAARPQFAYVIADQATEIETTSFPYLVQAGVPGVELIRQRLDSGAYTLVVEGPFFPPDEMHRAALASHYVPIGGCDVPFFYGRTRHVFWARRRDPLPFHPPPGLSCGLLPP